MSDDAEYARWHWIDGDVSLMLANRAADRGLGRVRWDKSENPYWEPAALQTAAPSADGALGRQDGLAQNEPNPHPIGGREDG